MLALRKLALTDMRSHARLTLEAGPGLVVLTGENGAGKTNILEAISLLAPGRGLRGVAPGPPAPPAPPLPAGPLPSSSSLAASEATCSRSWPPAMTTAMTSRLLSIVERSISYATCNTSPHSHTHEKRSALGDT